MSDTASASSTGSAVEEEDTFVHMPSPVPQSVTRVRVDEAFGMINDTTYKNFTLLMNVELPSRLQIIGEEAFCGCDLLETINFPPSLLEIRRLAFGYCLKLMFEALNEGLRVIGEAAFESCNALTKLKIPSTVTEIGKSAFQNCENLAEVEMPQGIKVMREATFFRCRALKRIKVPSSVTVMEEDVLNGCLDLTAVELPNGLVDIQHNVFSNCIALVSLEIPDSVENIEKYAFYNCKALRNLSLNERVFGDRDPTEPDHDGEFEMHGMDELFGPFPEWEELVDALICRFDGRPIHELCYHQNHHPTVENLRSLKEAAAVDLASGNENDRLGMTPFHIVALSAKPDPHLFSALLHRYSTKLLFQPDVWDMTPLDYLCQNDNYPLVAGSIQHLTVTALADRAPYLGLEEWVLDVSNDIYNFSWVEPDQSERLHVIHKKLERYERSEVTSLVELFVWKIKIENMKSTPITDDHGVVRQRKWIDRQACRVNCGADIVISNVLTFLGTLDEADNIRD